MTFRQLLADSASGRDTVLTIGVFDGVHLGHRHLLGHLIRKARPNCQPGVITFSNHPATVLRPDHPVSYITSLPKKLDLIRSQGIELIISLEFTPELSQIAADDFASILAETLHMKGLVIGPDFAFGQNRQGNAAFLKEAGAKLGFWVETVEPLILAGSAVHSGLIRQTVTQGDVSTGNRLLGRPFRLCGEVVRGFQRGRELGFPTANLTIPPGMMLPGDGIYATWAIINGQRHPSATSIGIRPTFGLTERLVEVYVLDFSGDLYGQSIGVDFVKKLRDQETFTGVEALIKQVDQDVADTRLVLAHDEGATVA
ncbi:MAG: bifunctional riboflavin kinase/FAD synthetase [Chloroflexi bacterium]|nr:bifunctional riboflavin kinase/FAD synthetase [Chloroflexota bacterium]PKB57947.1 MAG: riboflavin biosynthesis protein RibF [SAR202 cluster bacterium Casp-Chloro-G3]